MKKYYWMCLLICLFSCGENKKKSNSSQNNYDQKIVATKKLDLNSLKGMWIDHSNYFPTEDVDKLPAVCYISPNYILVYLSDGNLANSASGAIRLLSVEEVQDDENKALMEYHFVCELHSYDNSTENVILIKSKNGLIYLTGRGGKLFLTSSTDYFEGFAAPKLEKLK
jgi:hypothetical protein